MNCIAIRAECLSKQYHIGVTTNDNKRLSDQLVNAITSPMRRAGKLLRGQITGAAELDKTFWALKDVSFEIKAGEIVGIIGRNGAGKTTLLKILSRITEPTEGYADIYGRVGSLLEVGTGFHPELTGRENVYLNGAILGMRKAEIEFKFDEIVAFAEIEQFIDTPVKHYSSGMYVRLAFSVAAHFEPEILLVDEVLAVGDVAFQRKCLGKMDDVGKKGRTVLFVSHNMGLLQTLCQRGILIQQGRVAADGSITEVVDKYLQTLEDVEKQDVSERTDRYGEGNVRLVGVEVIGGVNGHDSVIKAGQPARFVFHIDRFIPGIHCEVFLYDSIGQPVIRMASKIVGPEDVFDSRNRLRFICDVDELLLLPGRYRLDVAIAGRSLQDFLEAAFYIDIAEGLIGGRPVRLDKKFKVSIPHRWTSPENNSSR